MSGHSSRIIAATLGALTVLAACDAGTADPGASTDPPPLESSTATTSPPPSTATPTATGVPSEEQPAIDPDSPIAGDALTVAPTGLGPRFETSNDALPPQTTGALHEAGGQALTVDPALAAFGIFGIPRPSGTNSAVMELNVTATRLGGADGTSLSTEVLYMVASRSRIDDLLVAAAATLIPTASATPATVPDYDGTTGDPRCARLPIETGAAVTLSVEGCEYRADPLTEVRSIGFRRLNLLVAGAPTLPAVFDQVPAELLTAGELAGYSVTFGRPAGPAGNTVQMRAQVHLAGPLAALGDGWQADGPGRWWSDNATVVVEAGTATWQSSTRAAQ